MKEEQRTTAQAKFQEKRRELARAACANGVGRNIQRSFFFYFALDQIDDASEFNTPPHEKNRY